VSAADVPSEAPAADAPEADAPATQAPAPASSVDIDTPPSSEVAEGAEGAEPGLPDHEKRVDLDLAELEAKAEKADEYLELARRTRADFDNFRKRAAREAALAQERGVVKLAKELLPAVDNLDRALAAAENVADGADDTLATGVKLVHAELLGALARAGIEPFSPQGEQFDPQRHEAMAQVPVDGAEAGTIVEVYQRGYVLGETILRPARVVVAG
jgi:molecular chaperone GrpE